MNIINMLINYFKAGFPCVAIQTVEEKRAQGDIIQAAKSVERKIIKWSASEGIINVENGNPVLVSGYGGDEKILELKAALRYLFEKKAEDQIIILRDIHTYKYDSDPELARLLRDVISDAPELGNTIVILSPHFKPYLSIESLVTIIDYALPNENELKVIAESMCESAKQSNRKKIKAEVTDDILRALSGLSTSEAENALSLCLVETGGLFSSDIIYREKINAIKRSGLLEFVAPESKGLDGLGGLENLKNWLLERKNLYQPEALKYGCEIPRGVFLVGVAGCGKSHSARAIGTAYKCPTLKLNMGSMFSKWVGESEQRMREALKLAEAMSPCVLFVDEADKGLAGAKGDGGTNEVATRVFGILLEWMQDKKKPVFVTMTANSVHSIPAPLLRAERFDEIFFVDLPNIKEREQIFSVHLENKKRDPNQFDLRLAAEATEDFSGAEIKEIIKLALLKGFNENKREITTNDLLEIANKKIPLSKSMATEINACREWGKQKAIPASAPQLNNSNNNRKLKL